MNRKLLIPIVAIAAGLSSAIAKKLAVLAFVGIGVPVAGYQFVQAVVASRAQAISRIDEHRNASQANRMVGPDNPHDVIEDLRSSLIIAGQMKARHDADGARQSLRETARVLKRAEAQSRQFKARLTVDRSISDQEIHEMERIDELSGDLRDMQRKLMLVGTQG